MKKYVLFILIIILIANIRIVNAVAPVLKEAMGFGINTPGGIGGQVIKVTNLNRTGAGSFINALLTPWPRVIVFEVGGIINLEGNSYKIIDPYLIVAGQTAPSPGITLVRGGLQIWTHDVVIQHIRIRAGDNDRIKVPWDIDAMTTAYGDAYNILIDHCSFSWGIDGSLDVSGLRTGPDDTSHWVTLSNNIIAETLNNSIHSKQSPHSRATLINDFCQKIAVIRNIYAHNDMRQPNFKPATTGIIVNNLIYDPGTRCIHTHGSEAEIGGPADPPKWSIIGNFIKPGPSTTISALIQSELDVSIGSAELFIRDNQSSTGNIPLKTGPITEISAAPVWPQGMVVLPSVQVYGELISHSGAPSVGP
ncbi:MAG TPA: pectate lyase [Phycisphaerales bacterium]|nr:pectate lyase [Phycisphaerales bacterium]